MQVVPVTNAIGSGSPTIGAVIPTGSFVQSLGTDSGGNIWASAPSFTDTQVKPNSVYVIPKGASAARAVAGLAFLGVTTPILCGKLP